MNNQKSKKTGLGRIFYDEGNIRSILPLKAPKGIKLQNPSFNIIIIKKMPKTSAKGIKKN